jgi:hypothetical protein
MFKNIAEVRKIAEVRVQIADLTRFGFTSAI